VREARRAIKDLGLIGVFLRPNPVEGRPWYHPDYEPLWGALEEMDAAVCFHEGGAVRLPQIGPDRFEPHPLWHVCTHPMEQQMAMLAIVMGGVAHRHPGLRFGFLECGAGWLPYWMWRMDEKFEEEHAELSITMKPSDYVRRQCFVSIDSDEEPGVFAIEVLADSHVVWGSDYPHHDGKYPVARKTVISLPGMTPARAQAVLQDAPFELFGERLRSAVGLGAPVGVS
jgi:predicted TIM-barrel fold metal-dependent hydrolase